MHRLTEGGALFLWTEECQSAFEKLCNLLTTAVVLAYPDWICIGIGAILSQVAGEGQERAIAYGSRVLSKAVLCHPTGTTGSLD